MSGFKELEGDFTIIVQNGVYKQVPLYERRGELFAAVSGGYVSLNLNGTTSKDKLRFVELSVENTLHRSKTGRLRYTPDRNSVPLEEPQQNKLLGLADENP